jgi:hypothetical protein
VRYGRHCQHEFVDAKTGVAVAPLVNVFADADGAGCMTLGRKYRCMHCTRIVDLRARARLPLPERPVDSRTLEPLVAANDPEHDVADTRKGDRPAFRERAGALL